MLISLDELAVPFVGVLAPAEDEGFEESGLCVRQRTVRPFMAYPSAAPEGYLVGAGAAFDEQGAELAARCEALERLSQCDVPSDLPTGTAEEIAGAVDPQAFVLFGDGQYRSEAFPYVPFTTTTRLRWVEGWDLGRRCPAMVPAQLVFPGLPEAAAESPIAYISSTGCAAGPDLASATLSALLEAVERDALMCTWKLGVSPSLLDPADLSAAARVAHAIVSDGGELDVRIADLSGPAGFPAVAAMHIGRRDDDIAFALGAACHATIGRAAERALAELAQVRRSILSMAESQLPAPTRPDFGDVRELHDHALVHARYANRKWNRFLWEGTTRQGETNVALTGATPVEQLAEAVRRLRSQAVDVYAVDLTTHEAASVGVTVVKVVCPQLQPLELWSCRYDDSRRLAAVLGADPTTIGPVDSGAPHPLA